MEDNLAHTVAKINMANSFADAEKTRFIFPSQRLWIPKKVKKRFNKKLRLSPFWVPFMKNPYPATLKNRILRFFWGRPLIRLYYLFFFLTKRFNKGDLLYIRGDDCLRSLDLAIRSRKISFVFEQHNYEFSNKSKSDKYMNRIMKNAAKIITISEYTRSRWARSGVQKEKILVLPSGVPVEDFNKIRSKKDDLRKRLSLPNGDLCCYLGSLYRNRGIEDILYAANENPKITFLFVGGHPKDVKYYRRYSKEIYGRLSNVIFKGDVAYHMVPSYLKASDILLAPYSMKCATVDHMSPVKILEYMASKTPIIVSDLPRIRDIADERCFYFFRPDDPKDLSKVIKRAINGDSGKMTRRAYKIAERYSWTNRTKKILKSTNKAS